MCVHMYGLWGWKFIALEQNLALMWPQPCFVPSCHTVVYIYPFTFPLKYRFWLSIIMIGRRKEEWGRSAKDRQREEGWWIFWEGKGWVAGVVAVVRKVNFHFYRKFPFWIGSSSLGSPTFPQKTNCVKKIIWRHQNAIIWSTLCYYKLFKINALM